jgi:hypothetical protein
MMMDDADIAIAIAEAKVRYANAWLSWLRLQREHPELRTAPDSVETRAVSLVETLGFLRGVEEGLKAILDERAVHFEPR